MRLERTVIHGLGPFAHAELDLTKVEGRVLAVTGQNGAGKTVFNEVSLPGVMYRTTPTRGSLADLATTRDAYVESTVVNGARYTIRHQIDAVSGKGESVVIDESGAPVLTDSKVRSFDRWSSAHLPAPEVLFASTFAAQGSGGFLDLKPADRKSVLLRVLGIEHLERLAEKAREHAREAKGRLEVAQARLADERARAPELEAAERDLAEAQRRAAEADIQLAHARATFERKQAEARAVEEARRAAGEHEANRSQLLGRLRVAQDRERSLTGRIASCQAVLADRGTIEAAVARMSELDAQIATAKAEAEREATLAQAAAREADSLTQACLDAERRLLETSQRIQELEDRAADIDVRARNNRSLLDRGDEIRAAVARTAELVAELQRLEAEEAQLRRDLARAQQDAQDHERRRLVALSRKAAAEKRADAARARLRDRASIEQAKQEVPALQRLVAERESTLSCAEAELEQLRSQRVAGAEERIQGLRGALVDVAGHLNGGLDEAQQIASDALTDDDAAVALAAELPARISRAEQRLRECREGLDHARRALTGAERVAARAGELEAAERELQSAEADALAAAEEAQREQNAVKQARAAIEEAQHTSQRIMKRRAQIEEECQTIEAAARLADRLAQAETRLAELDSQRSQVTADLDSAEASLPSLHETIRAKEEGARGASARAREHRAAAAKADTSRRELEQTRASVAPVAARAAELARAEASLQELTPQLEAARTDASEVQSQLDALGPLPVVPAAPDLAAAEVELRAAERVARDAQFAVPVREHVVAQAKEAQGRIAELDGERAAVETELADWSRLAEDLGKNGLQAMEIDAAGPELTTLVNDLLHTCVGTRWSLSIETQRQSADGKKTIEGCDVRVIDTERGRDASAESLSGGERVLVGEAISLALSMLACRRAGLEGVTLVRDETGAALDPVNARGYVAMLRRAAEIVGARHVLFVSHQPDTWELADACIRVADGKVEVC